MGLRIAFLGLKAFRKPRSCDRKFACPRVGRTHHPITSRLAAPISFPNHYHLVITFENTMPTHLDFVRHSHRELALQLNRLDGVAGRRVTYEFWDSHMTFERSWLARLNYVDQNAVKHGLVPVANQYPWCSAPWFETNGRSAFVKSVYSFKTNRIKVPDDF
jgi:putative transposase